MRWILLSILAGILCTLAGIGVLVVSYYATWIANPPEIIDLSLFLSIAFFAMALYLLRRALSKEIKYELLIKQEQSSLEVKLQEEHNRFETIFESTNLGVALLSLDGHFLRINTSLCELLGYNQDDMQAMNYYHLLQPNDLNNLQVHIQNMLDKKNHSCQIEQQCLRKNDEVVWVMATLTLIRDMNGSPIYFILQIQDISLQKRAEERLRHMAYHDPLTSVANRNKLEQFITQILASSRRHQQDFALLFLDLDRFKTINDTIGHEAGDLLLQIVAERLRNAVRNTDMVARLGGDEFVLLITDVKKTESIALIAQKILDSVLQVIMIKGKEIYITTSIGVSLFPYDGQTMQSLMKNADLALYRAKEHGRNNYQFYTSEMIGRAQEKLALQSALGHALVKDEFILHYQPKMDIKTRCITGVEALLRWKNKEYGMVTPDEIISLAEETGLVILVSEWVIKTACHQLKAWHSMGFTNLTMAVNCSARQFKQESFVRDILAAVTQAGIPPQSLEIEVTEATIMQDPETTLRVLYSLKDIGIRLAIDNFGTGYWSLSNLRRLSVDSLKIDKSFIKQVTVDETSTAIATAIIAMVNKLGIKSVAEGVETRDQYEFLASEGCREIQGYYLTQPLSQEAMTAFLKHPIPDAEAIEKNEMSTSTSE